MLNILKEELENNHIGFESGLNVIYVEHDEKLFVIKTENADMSSIIEHVRLLGFSKEAVKVLNVNETQFDSQKDKLLYLFKKDVADRVEPNEILVLWGVVFVLCVFILFLLFYR